MTDTTSATEPMTATATAYANHLRREGRIIDWRGTGAWLVRIADADGLEIEPYDERGALDYLCGEGLVEQRGGGEKPYTYHATDLGQAVAALLRR